MNEQWNNALDQVNDEYLSEAVSYRPRRHWLKIVGTMAAALVLVVSWSILRPEPPDLNVDPTEAYTTTAPTSAEVEDPTQAPTADPALPLPEETKPIPTLPLPEETQPIPTLPLPEETQPIPTLPLPEETQPTYTPPQETQPIPTVPDSWSPSNTDSYGIVSPHLLSLPSLAAAPTYPVQSQRPQRDQYGQYDYYYVYNQWKYQAMAEQPKSPDNAHVVDGFMKTAMAQFLSGNNNQVCSPMNIYFALATLAETTGGSTRQQILNSLGHSSIESLRAQAKALWLAHYYNNGDTESLLANSVWLDEDYSFYQSTLNTLATDYFASVFYGDLGSNNMDRQLAAWLDSQTGGLLTDYTQGIKLDPETAFCLASTAYFSADWEYTFGKGATKKEIFHCNGYDVNVDFMHTTFIDYNYYVDPIFSAISLELSGGHRMWLILPDEGYSPQDLLKQGNYYSLISDPGNWADRGRYKVNISMPKFDVSSERDLTAGLQAMGITEVFKGSANFSSITNASLILNQVSHAARVAVDEEGVIAAAYTIIAPAGSGRPPENEEVDFVLNRPFIFAITGSDDLPLFAGVVNKP